MKLEPGKDGDVLNIERLLVDYIEEVRTKRDLTESSIKKHRRYALQSSEFAAALAAGSLPLWLRVRRRSRFSSAFRFFSISLRRFSKVFLFFAMWALLVSELSQRSA